MVGASANKVNKNLTFAKNYDIIKEKEVRL